MSPVFIVALLALLFRLLGGLGVVEIDSWLIAVRWATGTTFIIMGAAHFTPIRHDVERLGASVGAPPRLNRVAPRRVADCGWRWNPHTASAARSGYGPGTATHT